MTDHETPRQDKSAKRSMTERLCRASSMPYPGAGNAWALFATFVVLIVLRAPHLLTAPRLWAEEGTFFFTESLQATLLGGLTYVTKGSAGYFLLSATLPTTIAAHFVPLEYAPFVTTYFSLAILLVPFGIIIWGRSYVWDTTLHKIVACGIVLFAPTSVGEAWLNSINSQIYCGLIALCIVCEDLRSASTRKLLVYGALLLFCGLSGAYTSFLFFAFLFKLTLERSRGARVCLALNAGTAVIQAAIFLQLLFNDSIDKTKLVQLDWGRSASHTLYGHFIAPLVGREFSKQMAEQLGLESVLAGREGGYWLALYGLLALVVLAGILIVVVDRKLRSKRNLLVVCLVSLSILTTVSSKYGIAGGRYGVLPGITLLLLILDNLRFHERRPSFRTLASAGMLMVSLSIGVEGYRDDPAFTCIATCPSWPEEVAKWRSNPNYPPAIWPQQYPPTLPQWRVRISPPTP